MVVLRDPSKVLVDYWSTEASYIIYKVGNVYYARNGRTGNIDFSSTDASEVVNDIINALPDEGGTIHFKAGTYELKSSIKLKAKVGLCGEGPYSTTLKLADGVNDHVLTTLTETSVYGYVTLRDFCIDGNKAGNPDGKNGINGFFWRGMLDNLYVLNCRGAGVRIQGIPVSRAIEVKVSNCVIADCDGFGVLIDSQAPDNHVFNCQIARCEVGVEVRSYDAFLLNNHVYRSNTYGINMFNCLRSRVIGNFIETCNNEGLRLLSVTGVALENVIVNGNSFYYNSYVAAGDYDAIYVRGLVDYVAEDVLIVNNNVKHTNHRYAINCENEDYCIIVGNDVRGGYTTGGINATGVNNIIANNRD